MRNMVFHTTVRGLLEKHWFMSGSEVVIIMRLKAVFLRNGCGGVRLFSVIYPKFVSGLLQELPMSHKTAPRFHAT